MATQTETTMNSSPATAAEPDIMSGSLKQVDDQALAGIVIEGAKQERRSGFALLELRRRFAGLKGEATVLGYRKGQWAKFCGGYLKLSDRQARRLIESTGEGSPAAKHDGSQNRATKAAADTGNGVEADAGVKADTDTDASTREECPAAEHGSHKPPQWCVKTPDGHDNFPSRSAFQKEVRRCLPDEVFLDGLRREIKSCNEADAIPDGVLQEHEQNACYWINQLYEAGCDVWKKLVVMMHEDVGIAGMAVWDEIRKLEQDAKRIKDNKNRPDRLVVFNAVLVLCRARKSRAADNTAIQLRTTKWRPRPVSRADIEAAAEAAKVRRGMPDYAIDMHTPGGRAMGRGMDFFLEEGTKLGNPAADVREVFSPDYSKGYAEGYEAGYAAAYAAILANESDAMPSVPTPTTACPHCGGTGKVAA